MSSWFELYGDDYFESLYMKDLGRDEAYLRITNNGKQIPVYLLKSHRECLDCNYYKSGVIYASETWKISTFFKYKVSRAEFDSIDNHPLCDISEIIGEFGVYKVTFNETDCFFETIKEPVNIYLPILTVCLIYLVVALIFFGPSKVWAIFKKRKDVDISENEKHSTSSKPRLRSLDTFRGISIVTMIFVNLGAGGYEILDHAPWNGLHMADLVFPCFLWIMGVCIPISLTSSFKKNVDDRSIIQTIAVRSVKLFCLGVFLNSGIYLDKLRFMAVLQRFGICYFVVSMICIQLLNRKLLLNQEKSTPDFLTSFTTAMLAWIPIICIVITNVLIIFFVSDENCEKGYLGPGGLHKRGKYENCTGGAVGYLDRMILGHHCYQKPTSLNVYKSQPFDPEGIIGCLNSIFHTFIGVQAGIILLIHKDHKTRIIFWLIAGVITGLLGGLLTKFSIEDGLIPINKNLWSLSFVLVTSSFAYILLTLSYILIDVKKWWKGQPFFYSGMNSILMYVGHSVTSGFFPFSWRINDSDTQTHFLFFLENVTATIIWVFIAYRLYKIKYFLTI